jgi:SNF2 family DNA or RNA helicase
MLRRLKTDTVNGKPLIELPERRLFIVPCDFDEDERRFYFALENKIDEAMKRFVKNNEVMKNYTNFMLLLLRLRQGESRTMSTILPFCLLMVGEACNHPSLVSKDYNTDREAIESPAPKDDHDDEELPTIFKQLGVSKGKKCQLCQDEYIGLFVSLFGRLLTSYHSKIDYREQRWRAL